MVKNYGPHIHKLTNIFHSFMFAKRVLCFFVFISFLFTTLSFSSCRTIEPTIIHQTDTCYITKAVRDSIFFKDSVIVKVAGDTVFVDRWHERYKDKLVHDTIQEIKKIEVPVPVKEIVEVEKKLNVFQKTLMALGLAFLIYILIKIYLRIKLK